MGYADNKVIYEQYEQRNNERIKQDLQDSTLDIYTCTYEISSVTGRIYIVKFIKK